MDEHGYFAGGPCYDVDRPAKHGTFTYDDNEYTMVVGHYGKDEIDGYWFAECEDSDGAAIETQASVQHPDLAIVECLAFVIAPTAFAEEGNCEDAVNRVAYDTFSLMFRRENVTDTGLWPEGNYELFMLDVAMGAARRAVRFFAKDLWQEF